MKFSLFLLIVAALTASTHASEAQKKGLVINWVQVFSDSINAINQLGFFPGNLALDRNKKRIKYIK